MCVVCVWLLCDQRAHGGGFWSRKQSKPEQKIPSGKGRIRIRASSAINRAKFEGRVKGDNKFNKHKMAPLALDPKAKWRSNTSGQQRAAIAAQRKSERKLAALNARLLELRPACSEVRPLVARVCVVHISLTWRWQRQARRQLTLTKAAVGRATSELKKAVRDLRTVRIVCTVAMRETVGLTDWLRPHLDVCRGHWLAV